MRTEQEKYCFSCGKVIDSRADACIHCSVFQPDTIRNKSFNERWLTALLLCFFVGVFGIHRFYLGRVLTGLLMLFTLGGLGIWYLIDLILIATGGLKDGDQNFVKRTID